MEQKNRPSGRATGATGLSKRQRVALVLGLVVVSGFLFWDGDHFTQPPHQADIGFEEMDEFISLFDQPEADDEVIADGENDSVSPAEQILAEAEQPPDDSMTQLIISSDSQAPPVSSASGAEQNDRPIRLTGTIYPIK